MFGLILISPATSFKMCVMWSEDKGEEGFLEAALSSSWCVFNSNKELIRLSCFIKRTIMACVILFALPIEN